MDLGIAGKVALVTGASSGLGLATARALLAEGARIAICSRDRKRIEAARAELGQASAFVCDLGDVDSRDRLVDAVQAELGPIDILIVNSGGPPSGPFESHAARAWTGAIEEHLGAAVGLVRDVLPGMRERRWGRILSVTSVSLRQPAEGMILSTTARAAVLGFIRSLSSEVARDGITVNNIMPGYTDTDRIKALVGQIAGRTGRADGEIVGDWTSQIPAGRLGRPDEFAAMAAFLCSDKASYVTGASIAVDGGWIKSLL